jgi:uncharacterized protein (UPF0332 family)
MDPRDFLGLARELATAESPAHHRTAITRAYYAVYNVACDLFLALGFDVERGHAGHEVIREWLRHSGVDRLIHVSAQLRRLHNIRIKADYWMQDPHPERRTTAERWLAYAERMVSDLDAALAEPATRERMTRALRARTGGDSNIA